jgi:hypothetical protein
MAAQVLLQGASAVSYRDAAAAAAAQDEPGTALCAVQVVNVWVPAISSPGVQFLRQPNFCATSRARVSREITLIGMHVP